MRYLVALVAVMLVGCEANTNITATNTTINNYGESQDAPASDTVTAAPMSAAPEVVAEPESPYCNAGTNSTECQGKRLSMFRQWYIQRCEWVVNNYDSRLTGASCGHMFYLNMTGKSEADLYSDFDTNLPYPSDSTNPLILASNADIHMSIQGNQESGVIELSNPVYYGSYLAEYAKNEPFLTKRYQYKRHPEMPNTRLLLCQDVENAHSPYLDCLTLIAK